MSETRTGTPAFRVDFGRLRKVRRTPSGGVRVPGAVARSGVLEYIHADGTTVREYLPPEEVGHADSLESLRDAVVTVSHPDGGTRLVTPETYRNDSVGHVSGEAKVDEGQHLVADLAILDAEAILAIDRGDLTDISSGYHCLVEDTPGVTPDGERYDRIQRRRTYNHVALLPKGGGRAGHSVCLRLDSADAGIDAAVELRADSKTNVRIESMETERIDGVDFKVGSSEWRQALGRKITRLDEENAKLEEEKEKADATVDELKAKVERLQAELDAAKAELAEATGEEKLDARVAERLALFDRARRVLGTEAKLDGKKDGQIIDEVLVKLGVELEGRSDDYKRARFDIATEEKNAHTPLVTARADAFAPTARGTDHTAGRTPPPNLYAPVTTRSN